LSLLEQRGLIGLDLQQVLAAFLHNDARGGFLAVERIGADDFLLQRGQAFQQRKGGRLFTARGAFLLIHQRHGHRGTIFMVGQGHQADVIADHFAIQGQGGRELTRLGLQPVVQVSGEGFCIQSA
jgi:hypothetical protein